MTSLMENLSASSAKAAGLRYVHDTIPGIQRRRSGTGFRYLGIDGNTIRDREILARIKSLVIPPAWRDVWICPHPLGHLQATGLDDRGRKQYRYHPLWRQVRDAAKYDRLEAFGKALSRIRRRVEKDLRVTGLVREKLLATVVRLLEKTLIRVGNEEYARENASFGLTTLRGRHIKVSGSKVHFEFRGKSGVKHAIDLEDKRLARILKTCQELPGQELFKYIDDQGQLHTIGSENVNEYLQAITGQDFTAKDFRTWAGTVLALQELAALEEFESNAQAKRNIVSAIESVAKRLGNTKAVCKKCYVHPSLLEAYLDGSLPQKLERALNGALKRRPPRLSQQETRVLALLQEFAKGEKAGRKRENPGEKAVVE